MSDRVSRPQKGASRQHAGPEEVRVAGRERVIENPMDFGGLSLQSPPKKSHLLTNVQTLLTPTPGHGAASGCVGSAQQPPPRVCRDNGTARPSYCDGVRMWAREGLCRCRLRSSGKAASPGASKTEDIWALHMDADTDVDSGTASAGWGEGTAMRNTHSHRRAATSSSVTMASSGHSQRARGQGLK